MRFPSEEVEEGARFDVFFEEEGDRLFRALYFVTGSRHDAEELTQDAFLKLWERWDQIDRIEDPTAYLFRDLFVVDVATGEETQITHLDQTTDWAWWFMFPSFVAGRDSVMYQLPSGDPTDPVWNLWSVPAIGGKSSIVAHNAGWGAFRGGGIENLAYVPRIDASTFAGPEIRISTFDRRGDRSRHFAEGSIAWLRWSPDWSRIAYSSNGSVYVVNVATGSTTGQVTKIGQGSNPDWFDDHTLIIGEVET